MGALGQKAFGTQDGYKYKNCAHAAIPDEAGYIYCRACNAVMEYDPGHCQNCILRLESGAGVFCQYYDFYQEEFASPIQQKAHTDGLISMGLVKEFPDFVADDMRMDRKEREALLQVEKALQFAADAHKGAFRKGTSIPYIIHPVEVAVFTAAMTKDPEVIVAAALHDVVEDTSYEIADIQREFGLRVAELVGHESEDKMRERPPEETWRIRKEEFLKGLNTAPIDAKIITLADKLSNMKQTAYTYKEKGPSMWEVFHEKDERQHAWYYRSVLEELEELSDTREWQQLSSYIDEVFGSN